MLQIDEWYRQINLIWYNDPQFKGAVFDCVSRSHIDQISFWLSITLSGNNNLASLSITRTHLSCQDFDSIFGAITHDSNIKTINLSYSYCDNPVDAMAALSSLIARCNVSNIYLSAFKLGDEAARFILKSMSLLSKNGKCFERLYMDGCDLTDSVVPSVVKFIKSAKDLKTLNISGNSFSDDCKAQMAYAMHN